MIFPLHRVLFMGLVALMAALDRNAIAQESTSAVVQACPDAAAYNISGHIHEAEGDYEQAIVDLTHAVKLAPDDMHYRNDLAVVYVYRGQAHLIQGNYEQGLADLRQYVWLARDNADPAVLELIAGTTGDGQNCGEREDDCFDQAAFETPLGRPVLHH
jgi:tetratricopeptide (TPR) repeat protein